MPFKFGYRWCFALALPASGSLANTCANTHTTAGTDIHANTNTASTAFASANIP